MDLILDFHVLGCCLMVQLPIIITMLVLILKKHHFLLENMPKTVLIAAIVVFRCKIRKRLSLKRVVLMDRINFLQLARRLTRVSNVLACVSVLASLTMMTGSLTTVNYLTYKKQVLKYCIETI